SAAGARPPLSSGGRDLHHSAATPVLAEHFDLAGTNCRAIIDSTRKLIIFENGRRELYDVVHDFEEQRNVVTTVVSADLSEIDLRLRRSQPAPERDSDSEASRRLRSLGYVQR